MQDTFGRNIDYMRISITDRCNLHCNYCQTPDAPKLPQEKFLSKDEILAVCKEAAALGITKFKITGGEPLIRNECVELIGELKNFSGVGQVTLTTNGILLADRAKALKTAGTDCINVSLDTLDHRTYEKITGTDGLKTVKEGIQKALELQIPLHINAVLQKEVNPDAWRDMVLLTKELPVAVRFIEMMPVGEGKSHEGISNIGLKAEIEKQYGVMLPVTTRQGNGPAVYYHIPGHVGHIGFISPIHGKFCAQCNRIRMTADGSFKPCLCYGETIQGRDSIRANDRESIRRLLEQVILAKPGMHCFETRDKITENRQMAQIGG